MVTRDRSKTLNMTIWDSTYFKANNRRFLNPRIQRFLPLSNYAITPLDCLGPDGRILSQPELDQKFGQEVPPEILEAVTFNFRQFPQGDPLPRVDFDVWPFFIPFNYESITKYKKGCSYWSRFLRRKKTANIIYMENKTETSLGLEIDQQRWKQIYWMVSNIKYGNDIKWFVHQILRGCLTTNYLLKKMRIRRCDLCTFCKNAEENIRHLFWDCPTVRHFLNAIKDELDRCWPHYDIGFTPNNVYGREVFLLGDNRANSGLAPNYMYNVVKKFIWNTRCLVPEHPPPPPPPGPQDPPPPPPPLPPTLSTQHFWAFFDKRIREDKILVRLTPELRFLEVLSDRRGIG